MFARYPTCGSCATNDSDLQTWMHQNHPKPFKFTMSRTAQGYSCSKSNKIHPNSPSQMETSHLYNQSRRYGDWTCRTQLHHYPSLETRRVNNQKVRFGFANGPLSPTCKWIEPLAAPRKTDWDGCEVLKRSKLFKRRQGVADIAANTCFSQSFS